MPENTSISSSEKTPNIFVAQVSLDLKDKLLHDLKSQGFELSTPPNTVFQAKKKGINCTLYFSGKLCVQGKDKDEFILYYIEPEIVQSFNYAHPHANLDMTPRIGIDEAGKGDFFGPLCIAGVYGDATTIPELAKIGVKDSKSLNDTKILELAEKIVKICPISVVKIMPQRYNELYQSFHNLNNLLAWGHATAIENLHTKTGCTQVTIDQFAKEHVVLSALKRKKLDLELTQRHKGESDIVVAAASILARAAFVKGIKELGDKIGMELPKGASSLVIQAGKELVKKHGTAILDTVGKTHFKTKEDILNA